MSKMIPSPVLLPSLMFLLTACNGSVLVPKRRAIPLPPPAHGGGDPGPGDEVGGSGDLDPVVDPSMPIPPPPVPEDYDKGQASPRSGNHPQVNSDQWDSDPNMDTSELDKGAPQTPQRKKKKGNPEDFSSLFNQQAFDQGLIRGIVAFERRLNAGGIRTLQHKGIVTLSIENLQSKRKMNFISEVTTVHYDGPNPEGALAYTKLFPASTGPRDSNSIRASRSALFIDGYRENKEWKFRVLNEKGDVLFTFASMRF